MAASSFRTKAREIEAFQMTFDRIGDNSEWPTWLHAAWNKDRGEKGALYLHYNSPRTLAIHTMEGPQLLTPNDWVINDGVGEIYPCKPQVFEEKYEPIG